MRFPDDVTMLALLALDNADGGSFDLSGRLSAKVAGVWVPVSAGSLDGLEAKGWVELVAPGPGDGADLAGVRVTDAGRYWLTRWVRGNRRRLTDVAGMMAAANTQPKEGG